MTTAQNLANLSQVFTNGPLSHRNRFINGCMRVGQRGGVTASSGVVTYSAADRWYVYSNGSSASTSNTNGSPVSPASLTAAGAAGNTTMTFGQKVESNNISDLAGKQVTISGYLYTPTTTVPNIVMYYPNAKDNFGTVTSILGAALLPSINANTWTYFSYTTTLPGQTSNGLQVEVNFGAITSGSVAMSGMQLEAGPVATPFEIRSYGYEFFLCQRYYSVVSYSGASLDGMSTNTTTAYSFGMQPPVPMRATPTPSLIGAWTCTTAAGNSGTVSFAMQTINIGYLTATGGSYTNYSPVYFGVSGNGSIVYSAEL